MTEQPENAGIIPGEKVFIGGKSYEAPPLTLGGIRELTKFQKQMQTEMPPVGLDDKGNVIHDPLYLIEWVITILLLSLRRNYSFIDENWLVSTMMGEEYGPAGAVCAAILGNSGMGAAKAGEPGEDQGA